MIKELRESILEDGTSIKVAHVDLDTFTINLQRKDLPSLTMTLNFREFIVLHDIMSDFRPETTVNVPSVFSPEPFVGEWINEEKTSHNTFKKFNEEC